MSFVQSDLVLSLSVVDDICSSVTNTACRFGRAPSFDRVHTTSVYVFLASLNILYFFYTYERSQIWSHLVKSTESVKCDF